MDVAGNNSETREFSGFMEDDEPKMGYRRERISPVENVLSRKTLYCHTATEVIFDLMIIGFNMRELYLYRRIQRFKESGISRKSVNRKFCDELLLEK